MNLRQRAPGFTRRGAVIGLSVLAAGALGACGGAGPPPDDAARLVPSSALVYVHLSTDSTRDTVQRASALLGRFGGYPALRDSVLSRLSAAGGPVDLNHDVKPWLGHEAALALLNSTGPTAGSLVLVEVSDRQRAQAFLSRSSSPLPPSVPYAGVGVQRYGRVSVAFIGHFLAVGQDATLRQAIDLASGRGGSLAADPTYRRATVGRPSSRVADVYVTAAGVRRLLMPQGGLLGAAGSLLDQPALQATELALSPGADRALVAVHNTLSPRLQAALPAPFAPFTPTLDREVPSNALAYLGVSGLDRAFGRLLGAVRASGGGLVTLLARVRAALSAPSSIQTSRDLASLLSSEVGIWIAPHGLSPALALIARTPDEARTRVDLASLQAPLAKAFAPPRSGPGQAPTFGQRRVAGIDVFSLRLSAAAELDYAVFAGRLVIATSPDVIDSVVHRSTSLAANPTYRAVIGDHPRRVSSLVFLDFSQLLALAEQTGLSSSPTYARIRDDLARIKAVGESSTGGQGQTNAELTLSIP
ncbi:MAG TPA: DUF3352 domain-containing protein [Solirubrobacteraceae bacterium]|nr:DUF3352 domain-containing protein [Solirubrobacteraceae bacterium]